MNYKTEEFKNGDIINLKYTEDEDFSGCDILIRSYFNIGGDRYIDQNPEETFQTQVLLRNGVAVSPEVEGIFGNYVSEHPQGVLQILKKVLMDCRELKVTFSNEYSTTTSSWLGVEFNGKDWMKKGVDRVKRGDF